MKEENFYLAVGKGKKVKTKFENLNIKDLRFYPQNPRISSFLVFIKGKISDDEIERLMWEEQGEATKSLYQQIKTDGQVNEPLTVYERQTIEGNTRLCVVRKLYEETGDKKWAIVPCRVIVEKLEKTQIDYILCNYHIHTKKDWMPYEQACYFYTMKVKDGLTYEKISRLTNVCFVKVMDYVKTFEKMLKIKARPNEWSLYYETVKSSESKRAMKEDHPDLIEKVEKKWKEGKIGRAEDARKLKVILKDKPTAEKFFKSDMDIDTAEKLALHKLPAESDPFLKDIETLTQSIEDMPKEKIDDIRKNKKKLKIIQDFIKSIESLCNQLRIKI